MQSFTCGSTTDINPKSGKKKVTQLQFNYKCKITKVKKSVISFLMVPRVCDDQWKYSWAAVRGQAPPKIACIGPYSYSWNPNEQFGNVFIIGPFNINKLSFLPTSNGDFGVKTPSQTCQQSFVVVWDIDGTSNQPTCGVKPFGNLHE